MEPVVRRQAYDPSSALAAEGYGATADARLVKGQFLFTQGDAADAVYFIKHGKLKITVLSEQGKEGVIGILEAGHFCGEGCLAGQKLRMSSVVALTESTVTRIDKAAIVRIINENSEFSEAFTAHLVTRNIRVESDLIDQLFNSSERRLARILLILADFDRDGMPGRIEPPISQETLAEMIGTTRSRVSYFMNKFRQMGFISYDGHLEVHPSLVSVVNENGKSKA